MIYSNIILLKFVLCAGILPEIVEKVVYCLDVWKSLIWRMVKSTYRTYFESSFFISLALAQAIIICHSYNLKNFIWSHSFHFSSCYPFSPPSSWSDLKTYKVICSYLEPSIVPFVSNIISYPSILFCPINVQRSSLPQDLLPLSGMFLIPFFTLVTPHPLCFSLNVTTLK